jgi:hypothetical protein
MLVVEVIKLNRILDLLMRHIVTSNWFKDRQKYPKSRTSIRIWQPETLERIKCHTFPGTGGRTLDILVRTIQLFNFFFVPKVLIEMPAHTNSFIFVMALRRQILWRTRQFD